MKLSTELQICVELALTEANRRHHEFATPEHLLFALLHDDRTRKVLRGAGASIKMLRAELEAHLDRDVPTLGPDDDMAAQPSLGFSRVVQGAALHVQGAGKDTVTPENVLVSLFSETDSYAKYLLERSGTSRLDVVRYISHGVSKGGAAKPGGRRRPAYEAGAEPAGGREPGARGDEDEDEEAAADPLEAYTVNLNERAKAGAIDPLIGREVEVDRVVHILARRRKNNPLLVGDAGVGKTAIVEGLARKVVEGAVPDLLKGVTIYALDMGALIAGTRYRGDFEERFKGVMGALRGRDDAILFVDEMHTIIGAGSVSGGSLDASNMLKPALAEGSLRVIGATTFQEHRKHLEQDRALARRFQVVEVGEPSRDDAVEILRGLKKDYEGFHQVTYTEPALEAAVDLSVRYLPDRHLPDKAIDVVDEAGASRRLAGGGAVDVPHMEAVVSSMAKVPVEKVTRDDRERLRDLEGELAKRVFGQDAAIRTVARAVKLARAGLRSVERPIGSFLFAGPTGVGKTELAKQLANVLGVAFLRFDMSEYMESHTVSRLIGAPPGYVGFDRGGLLTDAVTQNPHAVLLLDEIEKAHPEVFNILLQVMDHGTLTDNNGRKADFRHVVLIMTSNVGAQDMSRRKVGFHEGAALGDNDAAYKRFFSPEFRNRLDAKVDFGPLPREVMERIVDKLVAELEGQLSAQRVRIELTDAGRAWLADKGYDPAQGARPVHRVLRTEVSQPLAEEILYGALVDGGTVIVDAEDGALRLRFSGAS